MKSLKRQEELKEILNSIKRLNIYLTGDHFGWRLEQRVGSMELSQPSESKLGTDVISLDRQDEHPM